MRIEIRIEHEGVETAYRIDFETKGIEVSTVVGGLTVEDWREVDWLHAADRGGFALAEAMFEVVGEHLNG